MPGELCLKNRQHTRPINLAFFRRLAHHLLVGHFRPAHYEFCVHLVEATEMAEVNERFLRHPGSTDVITFDYAAPRAGDPGLALESLHGEIFISLPDAVTQAQQFGTTWQLELTRYLIHGLLHLHGYDDLNPTPRRAMKREENRLLQLTSRHFDLTRLGKSQAKRRPRKTAPAK
jgi:probable rRNA maturation factor